jgi:ferritin-like metal-binding protein YciE
MAVASQPLAGERIGAERRKGGEAAGQHQEVDHRQAPARQGWRLGVRCGGATLRMKTARRPRALRTRWRGAFAGNGTKPMRRCSPLDTGGTAMASTKKIQDLLIDELSDVFSAETQITQALPKLIAKASARELKDALSLHLDETKGQIDRLKKAFSLLKVSPEQKTCKAMEGLVAEADELLQEGLAPEVLDIAIIAAAQKVEHYEIASYGSLHAYADACGLDEVAALLRETLAEEKKTDESLTGLATATLNARAVEASVN